MIVLAAWAVQFLISLAFTGLFAGLAYLTRPKTPDDIAPDTSTINWPTAENDRVVPYVCGTVRLNSQNLVSYGGVSALRHEHDSGDNDGALKSWFWNATMLNTLCIGPLVEANGDGLFEIYAEEVRAWPYATKSDGISEDLINGTIANPNGLSNGKFNIKRRDLFGGNSAGNGGFGNIDDDKNAHYKVEIWNGAADQTQSESLADALFNPTEVQAILNEPPEDVDTKSIDEDFWYTYWTAADDEYKWIIGDNPTGEWEDKTPGDYAIRIKHGPTYGWGYSTPTTYTYAHVIDTDEYYQYINSEWVLSNIEIPAYRNFVNIFYDDFYFGNSGSIPNIEYVIGKFPNSNAFGTSNARYLADERWKIKSTIKRFENGQYRQNYDSNPIEILWDILNDSLSAAGISTIFLKSDDFLKAANQCYNENLGIGFIWDRAGKISSIINEILKTIDAVLVPDQTTGKIGLKMLRNDYPVLTEIIGFSIESTKYDSITITDTELSLAEGMVSTGFDLRDADYNKLSGIVSTLNALTDTTCIITEGVNSDIYTGWLRNVESADITSSYDVELDSVESFDENDIGADGITSYVTGTWKMSMNTKNVSFINPDLDYQKDTVRVQDLGGLQRDGRVKGDTVDFSFIHNKSVASNVAGRELYLVSMPIKEIEFPLNRIGWDLHIGDVINISFDKLGISSLYVRIGEIDFGKNDSGEIKLKVSEDIFSLEHNAFEPVPDRFLPPLLDIARPATQVYNMEMPYHLLKKEYLSLSDEQVYIASLVTNPGKKLIGWNPYLSVTLEDQVGGENPVYHEFTQFLPFYPSGTIKDNDYLENNCCYLDTTGLTLNINSNVFGDLGKDETEGTIKNLAINLAIIEANPYDEYNFIQSNTPTYDEIIGYTTTTTSSGTITLNNVYRGLLDTIPRSHRAGTRVWLLPKGINWIKFQNSLLNEVLLKHQTVGHKDVLEIDNATEYTVKTSDRRFARPYAPGKIRVVQNESLSELEKCWPTIFNWDEDITLSWNKRHRVNQAEIYHQDDAATKDIETYDSTYGYGFEMYDSTSEELWNLIYENRYIEKDEEEIDLSASNRDSWTNYDPKPNSTFNLWGKKDKIIREYEETGGNDYYTSRFVTRKWDYAGLGLGNENNGGASEYD